MKLRPQSPGTAYLKRNLLPLVESIKPKKTNSHILHACGLGDTTSSQSILITIGGRFEHFWDKVITDSKDVQNQLPFQTNGKDRIMVKGENRQVDLFFSINDNSLNPFMYLECKCNLELDSEKKPKSNDKILDVCEQLQTTFGNTHAGYFVPVLRDIEQKHRAKFIAWGIPVYGVEDMFRWLNDVPFTIDEYFTFLLTDVGPLLKSLLESDMTDAEVSTEKHGGDLDAL